MVIIKQGEHSTTLGSTRDHCLKNSAQCGNCLYKDLLIGFAYHYDWESNSCPRLQCPKCESRLIFEYKPLPQDKDEAK